MFRRTGETLQANQGALFYLDSDHFETDPIRNQYRLRIDKLTFIGSQRSLTFTQGEHAAPTSANKAPAVVSLLQKLKLERENNMQNGQCALVRSCY